MDQIDDAGELGQIVGLFDGRIAAADHGQRLVAESRQRAVADRTRADAAVLELLFRRQPEIVRPGAGGHDHGVRLVGVAVGGGQLERLAGEIDVDDVLGNDARAEVDGLLPHQFHEFRPADALLVVRGHELPLLLGERTGEVSRQIAGGKAGIVLDLGRQGQLAQRQRAGQAVLLGDGPLEDERLQGGSGRVDRGRPSGGAAADDDDFFGHETVSPRV